MRMNVTCHTLRARVRQWLASVPGCCAACQSWSGQGLCSDCLRRFAPRSWRCTHCALRTVPGVSVCGACLVTPPLFDAAWAAVDYDFPWAHLIARFKFQDALDLTGSFADLMLAALPPEIVEPRLLIPVPLSTARWRQRGYNQAWELARRLGSRLSWPASNELVLRTRHTHEQVGLAPLERQANLRNAFALPDALQPLVHGRAVVLVDDVMTTGATANALAKLLKQAGASSVTAWVLARTASS